MYCFTIIFSHPLLFGYFCCSTTGAGVFQQQGINSGLLNQQQPATSTSGLFNLTVNTGAKMEGNNLFNPQQQDTQLQWQQQQLLALINSPFDESLLFHSSTKARVAIHKVICLSS